MTRIVVVVAALLTLASSRAWAQDPNRTYQVGEKVEVRWAGDEKWYGAEILEVRADGQYFILYTADGNNAVFRPDRMRPLAGAPPHVAAVQPPANVQNQPGAAAQAGPLYKPGDRVECDLLAIGTWDAGTVLPYLPTDEPGENFYIHRVRTDKFANLRPEGGFCFTERMRPAAGAAAQRPVVDPRVGEVTLDADGTVSPVQPILACPVPQSRSANGERPDPGLLTRIVRCDTGEKPAARGYDGAVTVDVAGLEIGRRRTWDYLQDMGSGEVGTFVHPVKVTYTVKTHYRTRTQVEENWIRIVNFYVNAFGEWQSGSEEPVRSPDVQSFPRNP
jgi:hypothetical protein